ncbi:MAG: peptidoglycan-binding protein [Acidimicrobiia bacterium]|nr:MAG: peptidoglycan-binding protein [Acidimicrobiia bacterium]
MALYRVGDTGEAVRDIQDRLVALGFSTAPDPPGVFDEGTMSAVRAFQKARRLTPDGMVGRETWRTMVDAGHRLGDRLLYHRMPMLHGDDVADLQRRLNALGFDAGRVDGIFGAATLRAVLDYQQNRQMSEDGIVGPEMVGELSLVGRETAKMGRHHVRERVWLSSLPTGLVGQRVFIDAFCRDDHEAAEAWTAAGAASLTVRDVGGQAILSRSADTRPAERLRADHSNEVAADMVLAFCHPDSDEPGIYYFASAQTHSEAGAAIASGLAAALGVKPLGRNTPLLRATRAPAVVVSLPRLDSALGRTVVRDIESWLQAAAEGQPPRSAR